MNATMMVQQMTMMLRNKLRHLSGRPLGPMSCPEVGKLLQSYLDGELDPERTRRIAEHLEDCRRCGLEAETYERIIASISASRGEVPAEQVDRLRAFGERLAEGEQPPDTDDMRPAQ